MGDILLADSKDFDLEPVVLIFKENIIRQKELLIDFYMAYNNAVKMINKYLEKYRYLLLEKGGFPESIIVDIVIPHFKLVGIPIKHEVEKILNWIKERDVKKVELSYWDFVEMDIPN
ncbi:hypothetical protein BBF96_06470 [Anoxybacter fermentans]|uniref:Uncharacterized protein n=1 Tax=Anoxybacter fermentans TaxID=1323375 RepID=A0A3S9SXN8_9FIRM|nr:hypothetical protein [Anoxybacter fermentans]AZR73059.1 hypothetical protein BBF96_06470 [Anoxybacter fermentans]